MMGDLITVYVKSPSIPAQGVLGDYIDRCIMYTQVPACLVKVIKITCGCGHAHSQTRGWKCMASLLEGATFFNWKVLSVNKVSHSRVD